MDKPSFTHIRLWDQDAVVLFDWLLSVDFAALPISHPAQKQALTDLLTQLEQLSIAASATAEQIEAAKSAVARDMDW